jgi:hypothetical protein
MRFRALRSSLAVWSLSWLVVLGIGVTLAFPGTASAQVGTSINGTVRDPSGAVIPAAKVVLHNVDTKLDLVTVTNSAGLYAFPSVQPGAYDIGVSKQGFSSADELGVNVVVDQIGTYDITLKTGAVSETVKVQATANEVETASAELGVAIVKAQVNDLPLNGRNFTQLLNLTPGVSSVNVSQNSATSGGVWSNPIGSFSYPSINGQSNRSNLFLLDGVNNQGSFGSTYAVPPIIDDIQEFKVQSHNDDASFGGVMGGIVNVVTKSGTTNYHGSAWEFLRNTSFDARNALLTNKTPFQQNQFGAAAGGPVSIPWHNSGSPKTFFFLAYEGFRNNTTASNFFNTPTPAELGGDLSAVVSPIYNPYSVMADPTSVTGFTSARFMCDGAGNPLPATNGIQPSRHALQQNSHEHAERADGGLRHHVVPSADKHGEPLFQRLWTAPRRLPGKTCITRGWTTSFRRATTSMPASRNSASRSAARAGSPVWTTIRSPMAITLGWATPTRLTAALWWS